MQPKPDEIEIVLEVGAEGGSITLQGVSETQDRWRFRLVRDESTMAGLLDDDDLSPEDLYREGEWVTSWNEALAQLDMYKAWPVLFPLSVHPLFASRILAAVQERLAGSDRRRRSLSQWQERCT